MPLHVPMVQIPHQRDNEYFLPRNKRGPPRKTARAQIRRSHREGIRIRGDKLRIWGLGGFDFVVASGSVLLGSAEARLREKGEKGVKSEKGVNGAAGRRIWSLFARISFLQFLPSPVYSLRPIVRFRRGS